MTNMMKARLPSTQNQAGTVNMVMHSSLIGSGGIQCFRQVLGQQHCCTQESSINMLHWCCCSNTNISFI